MITGKILFEIAFSDTKNLSPIRLVDLCESINCSDGCKAEIAAYLVQSAIKGRIDAQQLLEQPSYELIKKLQSIRLLAFETNSSAKLLTSKDAELRAKSLELRQRSVNARNRASLIVRSAMDLY